MAGYVAASTGVEASSGEETSEGGRRASTVPPLGGTWSATMPSVGSATSPRVGRRCKLDTHPLLERKLCASVPLLARVRPQGGGEVFSNRVRLPYTSHSQSAGCIVLARRPSLIDLSRQACRRRPRDTPINRIRRAPAGRVHVHALKEITWWRPPLSGAGPRWRSRAARP